MEITIPANKEKIAVVVVGYNKYKGLQRLLNNLNDAYYGESDVPLVISIDASGNTKVYELARSFEWRHGVKYVNIEKERLGLKNHIFQCASLSKLFKGAIVLEDDLFVSPYFYHYAKSTVEKYGHDEHVGGIALYSNEMNGFAQLPFIPVHNGFDVFAKQAVCSWGEIWTESMWNGFTSWYERWDKDFSKIDMYKRIKEWERAWSKFYYAYLISTGRYFIYPYEPLSTNFNDAGGEHGGKNTINVHVSLLQGKREYQLGDFEQLVKYDVYSENTELPDWLGMNKKDIDIDLYSTKESYNKRYVLTTAKLPFKIVKGFALAMRPWELNVKYGVKGEDICLYDRGDTEVVIPSRHIDIIKLISYYLRGFNHGLIMRFDWIVLKQRIKEKLRIKK